jgi:hypothetical protein
MVTEVPERCLEPGGIAPHAQCFSSPQSKGSKCAWCLNNWKAQATVTVISRELTPAG